MTYTNSTGYTVSSALSILNGDRETRITVVCWIFIDHICSPWKLLWMLTNFWFVEDVTMCHNLKYIAVIAAISIVSSGSH
jgi:hypothetical protein